MSLETALIAAVRLVRGDPEFDVRIDGKGEDGSTIGWATESGNVRITGLGITRQGEDEQRLRAGSGAFAQVLTERIYGNRSLRLQFSVETNAQTLTASAEEMADDLRAGLCREDVAALLRAENAGVPRCGDVRTVPYRDPHGDWRSAAVFEAVFPWSRRHVPAAGVSIDRIGAVEHTGTISGGSVDPLTLGPTTTSEGD